MRKKTGIALISLALSVACAGTSLAAWNSDDRGWWYQYDDGRYAKAGMREVEGALYCFDADGYMQTGWQYVNWKWRYFDASGPLVTGWTQLDGKWYYLDPADEGAMYTYWLELPDAKKKGKTNMYYLNEDGVLQTGIFYLSRGTSGETYAYQADENGVLMRNKTVKNGGTEIRYDEFGVIRFRNAETKKNAQRDGTDEWQYLLSESELENQSSKASGEYDDYNDYDDYDDYYDDDYDYYWN